MRANKKSSSIDFDDDIPDLSTPEWRAKFAAAKVKRGRPPALAPKISTTIRLDPDILSAFQTPGPWLANPYQRRAERMAGRAREAEGEGARQSGQEPGDARAPSEARGVAIKP